MPSAPALSVKNIRTKNWYASAHFKLGLMYHTQTMYDDAEREYRHALEIDPNSYESLVNLGIVLYHQRKTKRSLTCLRLAVQKNHHRSLAHLNLAAYTTHIKNSTRHWTN